jgi:2-C-methyl-D-erythritol 2,4-cyclodiphosphate synthase
MATMRIGHGFDVHRFGEGDGLWLAGVKIPFDRGFVAHSDGDVALHAVIDAILGASGQGDIGRHFPDTDPQYQGISSIKLLAQVWQPLLQRQWRLGNLDVTLVAQAPKLSPYIEQMQQSLAAALVADLTQINVKATTTEGLGYTGRREGIAVHAVVLLIQDGVSD